MIEATSREVVRAYEPAQRLEQVGWSAAARFITAPTYSSELNCASLRMISQAPRPCFLTPSRSASSSSVVHTL